VQSDGKSLKDHLEALQRFSGKRDSRLDTTQIPTAGFFLWKTFWSLSARRTSNGFGPNPLMFSEVQAYTELFEETLGPRELEILFQMDDAFLSAVHKLRQETT
jgi:hypothetical protein